MQITLKQHEIETAVKGYLVSQGINLVGKDVTVGFTAGRAANGLSAEIDIEDMALGGQAEKCSGMCVEVKTDKLIGTTPTQAIVDEVAAEVEPEPEPEPVVAEEAPEPAPVTRKGESLFA